MLKVFQELAMEAMKLHGLYCVALTDTGLIGLTDAEGDVYDTVLVTKDGNIIDGDEEMEISTWLGY